MPLRTIKPFYRVIKRKDRYELSYFTSTGRQLLLKGSVEIPLGDKPAYKEMTAEFVAVQIARRKAQVK